DVRRSGRDLRGVRRAGRAGLPSSGRAFQGFRLLLDRLRQQGEGRGRKGRGILRRLGLFGLLQQDQVLLGQRREGHLRVELGLGYGEQAGSRGGALPVSVFTASTPAPSGYTRLPPGPGLAWLFVPVPPSTLVWPLPPRIAAIATCGSVKPPMSLMNARGAFQPIQGPLMKL